MTDALSGADLPVPLFHHDSGALRFWVATPAGMTVGAILPRHVLHHRFHARMDGSDAVDIYDRHREEIDAAVVRRVSGGSIEPVMLRESDLPTLTT